MTEYKLVQNNKEYLVFIYNGQNISGEPFIVYNNNHLQIIRDIGFNGFCNLGDILEFDIVALERNNNSTRGQLGVFLKNKRNNKATNEIKWCHVKYILNDSGDFQNILDNFGNIIGKIKLTLDEYHIDKTTHMFMHPEAIMDIALPT